jgi:hypothetical protein
MFVLRADRTAKYVPAIHFYIETAVMASDRANLVRNVEGKLGSILPMDVQISITVRTQNN